MRRPTALATLLAAALIAPLAEVRAQGEDAVPLRPGTIRINLLPDWARWNERFGLNTPGRSDGSREPLDVDFGADSLGAAQLPFLASAQTRLRTVTSSPTFALNLGRSRLTLNNSVRVVPIGVDWAVSRRLVLRAALPIVRARVEAFLLGPDSTAVTQGNVGLNPELAAPGTLDAFRTQVDAALSALQTQAASGPAALRAQAQAAYDALRPLLCDLYTLAAGNADASTSPCFNATGVLASPVLPVDTSAEGVNLANSVTTAQNDYEALRQQYAGQGVAIPAFTAGYLLPSTRLDSNGLRAIYSRSGGPLAGDSLTSIVRTRIGNVEFGAWYQLAMGPRWRSQVEFTLRLPTGTEDSPHNFIDLGTGTRAMGYEVAMRNDFVLRPDFWLHAGVRVGGWSSFDVVRRVGPANAFILPISDTATVSRAPGLVTAIDVVPNWQLDDAFRLGVGVHWFRQAAMSHSYVNAADEVRIGLPAEVLDDETSIAALRIGAGITFSTVNRYAAGRASLPYSVTASYNRTFSGSGGKVPAASSFALLLRAYLRL